MLFVNPYHIKYTKIISYDERITMADDEENTPQEVAPETAPAEALTAVKDNKYLLKERYEIDFSTPLAWLDNNGAKAYKVQDKIDEKKELFALICNNITAPRSSLLPYIKSIDNPYIMKLVEYGTVTTPPKNSRNMALIYKTPLGGKIFENETTNADLKNHPDRLKTIILNLLSASEVLKGYNITHRSIRTDNIYYRSIDKKEIVLGDCLATFPAFNQPPSFETIESLLSLKEGRGNGSEKNDIYAIGVVALSLYLGHTPLSDLSAPEILRLKIKKGSLFALLGEEKLSSQLLPVFKGLLNDYQEQRLGYIQAYNILEGKPGATTVASASERPKKSLTINGEKVYTARDVAVAMLSYPNEAFELIRSGKVLDWIKNGLENESLAAKVEKVISGNIENITNEETIVSKICILIAPQLPIKLKDMALFPDGTPKAIFYTIKSGNDIKPFYDLFSSDLIKLWYQEQENMRSPANAAEFKAYINRKDLGYGIDRIMYDFDEDLPCISPLLGDEFVNSASRVLRALDHTYATKQVTSAPFDKTIIAYLRCKMGKKIDGILTDLNTNRDELQASAILRLYTSMQNKFGPAKLPNLAKWLVSSSMKIIKSYHNLKFQKTLERELLKINKNGKLFEICEILEDEDARQKDRIDYAKAINDANYLLNEKNKILNSSHKLDEEAHGIALRFASILAVLAMTASFVFNIIIWWAGQ